MAPFLSSSKVHFSFNDFKISILPFQLAWMYFTLGLDGRECYFLASFVSDRTFMTKVDT